MNIRLEVTFGWHRKKNSSTLLHTKMVSSFIFPLYFLYIFSIPLIWYADHLNQHTFFKILIITAPRPPTVLSMVVHPTNYHYGGDVHIVCTVESNPPHTMLGWNMMVTIEGC